MFILLAFFCLDISFSAGFLECSPMTLSLLGYLCAQMSHVLAPLPGAELLHQSHVHTMYLSVVASLSSES